MWCIVDPPLMCGRHIWESPKYTTICILITFFKEYSTMQKQLYSVSKAQSMTISWLNTLFKLILPSTTQVSTFPAMGNAKILIYVDPPKLQKYLQYHSHLSSRTFIESPS